MVVYIIDRYGKALMPTTARKAKVLLKEGKAKVIRRTPFTLKLLFGGGSATQPLTLGVDTGSGKIGSAVVKENGDVVYLSEIEVRNDIANKMEQRSKYRRNRRNRKTRYRKARWLNRKNSIKKGRFSPTMTSKINSHLKEIGFVKAILPVTKIILETATFDLHALKNPAVLNNKWLYQKGINYGFANTRAYVLARDHYTCRHCKGKSKDRKLEVHHLIFRRNKGSDAARNLITLCKTCHDKLHAGSIILKGGESKGQLSYATQMNSIRTQLLRLLPEAEETFGFITKEHRQFLKLPKEHYYDAVAIASLNYIKKEGLIISNFRTNTLISKKGIANGDYRQSKGIRSEQKLPSGKIQGFRKFDKVKYLGSEYFIKGRMSIGYAILMDITGNKLNLKPIPKFTKMKRIGARKTWLVIEQAINYAFSSPL